MVEAYHLGVHSTLEKRGILKTPSPTLMTAEEKRRQQARIKLAQQSLRDLGLYRGSMDGVLGSMTQAALAGWLAENRHAKDTELNDYLVGKLGQAAQRHLRAIREAEARQQAQGIIENGYRGYDAQQMSESLIVGGPDECVNYIKGMEDLGVTHMLFRCALDDRENALQTIRVLGKEVIPKLR